ncbi:vesicle-associated membrane protein 3-like isoform X2 [Porites lutea]|uniref:vesicle-associated membrane protein 3-like isoform X2 n=1 Tax=Porites lutea TaxID=51062 RepID=UPI003CC5E263
MSNKRLEQTQAEVNEAVGIMKNNVEKVLKREANLSEAEIRAENLQQGASQFAHNAASVKRKMWWQNFKMWIILIVVIIVIIAAIVIWVVANQSSSSSKGDTTSAPATTNVPHNITRAAVLQQGT